MPRLDERYVTFKQILVGIPVALGLIFSAFLFVLEGHAGNPHKDAASKKDVENVGKRVKESQKVLREDIRELRRSNENLQKVLLMELRRIDKSPPQPSGPPNRYLLPTPRER